jgi:hypothetical protein
MRNHLLKSSLHLMSIRPRLDLMSILPRNGLPNVHPRNGLQNIHRLNVRRLSVHLLNDDVELVRVQVLVLGDYNCSPKLEPLVVH